MLTAREALKFELAIARLAAEYSGTRSADERARLMALINELRARKTVSRTAPA